MGGFDYCAGQKYEMRKTNFPYEFRNGEIRK